MNKKEYLQKKGLLPPDLGVLYIINSTRFGITLTEEPIWEIIDVIGYKQYIIKKFPCEIIIYDGKEYGVKDGYGSGMGDLWEWSYFATLDKDVANKLFEEEKLRIAVKYQLIF